MAQQVLDSKDQFKALETGVIPVPPDVAADNARLVTALPRGAPVPPAAPEPAAPSDAVPLEDAAGAEDDVEGEDGLTPRQKRDLTKKMQISIGKKHRQLKEAEEFAAAQYNERKLAEDRAAAYEREVTRLRGKNGSGEPKTDPAAQPRVENFANVEDYQKAVIDWRVTEILKERAAEAVAKEAAAQQQEIARKAVERLTRARETVPDFAETVEHAAIPVPQHIGGYLLESELLPELGYYFAKHPDELARLSRMSVSQSLVALGKIEAIIKPFEAPPAPPKADGKKPSSNGGEPPSTETGANPSAPSRPRAAAPITPLNAPSAPQSDTPLNPKNVREEITRWNHERQGDILRRKRH